MPARPIDRYYQEQIAKMGEQGLKSPAIANELEKIAKSHGQDKYPSERTVRTYWEKHMARLPEERRAYSEFRWPDSMVDAEIPWEASNAILDWIRSFELHSISRPMIVEAKWYWRVSQVAPTISEDDHTFALYWLAERELNPNELTAAVAAAIDVYLVHQPWLWAWDEAAENIQNRYAPALLRAAGADGSSLFEGLRPKAANSLLDFVEGVLAHRGTLRGLDNVLLFAAVSSKPGMGGPG